MRGKNLAVQRVRPCELAARLPPWPSMAVSPDTSLATLQRRDSASCYTVGATSRSPCGHRRPAAWTRRASRSVNRRGIGLCALRLACSDCVQLVHLDSVASGRCPVTAHRGRIALDGLGGRRASGTRDGDRETRDAGRDVDVEGRTDRVECRRARRAARGRQRVRGGRQRWAGQSEGSSSGHSDDGEMAGSSTSHEVILDPGLSGAWAKHPRVVAGHGTPTNEILSHECERDVLRLAIPAIDATTLVSLDGRPAPQGRRRGKGSIVSGASRLKREAGPALSPGWLDGAGEVPVA